MLSQSKWQKNVLSPFITTSRLRTKLTEYALYCQKHRCYYTYIIINSPSLLQISRVVSFTHLSLSLYPYLTKWLFNLKNYFLELFRDGHLHRLLTTSYFSSNLLLYEAFLPPGTQLPTATLFQVIGIFRILQKSKRKMCVLLLIDKIQKIIQHQEKVFMCIKHCLFLTGSKKLSAFQRAHIF